jgi:hypothetical protein
MHENKLPSNYGYGHAKQALFELICTKTEREKYNYYINNLPEVDALLVPKSFGWLMVSQTKSERNWDLNAINTLKVNHRPGAP